jgi:hypothetical protein
MITSKKTDTIAKKLEQEYAKIRAKTKDKKCKVIDVGRRVTLEMDLTSSVLADFNSPKQNHMRTL